MSDPAARTLGSLGGCRSRFIARFWRAEESVHPMMGHDCAMEVPTAMWTMPSVDRPLLMSAILVTLLWPASATLADAGVNVWTSSGPPGGIVSSLAVDPASPATVYAVSGGGVFKIGRAHV